jgi:hypothetical protein
MPAKVLWEAAMPATLPREPLQWEATMRAASIRLLYAGDFNRSMQHIDQIVQLVF